MLVQFGVPAIIVILVITILATGYVKAPPDKAFIISGYRKKKKILIGRAGIKIPFLDKKDELMLESISIDVKTSSAVPTADYININVDSVANVQIDTTEVGIERAAKNFLNRYQDYISKYLREILEGNLREIIGQMRLEEMVSNRKKFSTLVLDNAAPDLAEMGIRIISFNVQNFSDNNGVIEDLGIDNISKIKKDAKIAQAEANKEVTIKQAEADKQANDARVQAELEIARKNQELEIKKAELKTETDVKIAQADAAYKIQEQEERKRVEISTQNADIAKAEKEQELKRQQVLIEEQALEAQIKKKAEAEKYAEQQRAEADLYRRQKEAEAERFEREQEAVGIQKVGEAQADAIRQKGLAEAESMEKKAEAYQKYNQVAMAEMLIKVLPEVAGKIAEPLAAIDKVTIIGGGNDNGIASLSDNVPQVLAKTFETFKELTGYDLTDTLKANGYEAAVTKNINVTGLEGVKNVPKEVTETAIQEIEAEYPETAMENTTEA
jgi:Uncharacterized protein conserved in bacteria